MTNLDRFKIELNNQSYYDDDTYTMYLKENGVEPLETYTAAMQNKTLYYIYKAVSAVLESLLNNIDVVRSVQTEFTTTASAYQYIKDRIDCINTKIEQSAYADEVQTNVDGQKQSTISYMFYN